MSEPRAIALSLAIDSLTLPATDKNNKPASTDTIVQRAQGFLAFLEGSTSLTAPTPTASPLAEPQGTEPARLDDPKVVAAAEAVIEHPPVTDDASSGTSSDAAAASSSTPAPSTEAAPAADASSPRPEAKEVNAAVLAYNRKLGREKTLALLNKYGGSKVPEIDPSRWADLLLDLNAGINL